MGIFKRPRIGFPLTSLDVKGINDFFQAVMYKLTGNIDFGDMSTKVNGRIDDIEFTANQKLSYDQLVIELTDYITANNLTDTLSGYATYTAMNSAINTATSDKITASQLATQLANYITSGTFSSTLANYVTNSNLTTKLGEDYIITGKILANQIAAGTLTGFTINALNTLKVDGSSGNWAQLLLTSAWGKVGGMFANDARGINFSTDSEYGFTTNGAPVRALSDFYRNWTDRLVGLSEFGSSKADNGWCGLPNGIIIQWGYYGCGNRTDQPWQVNFPVTFPHQCFSIIVGSDSLGNADGRIFRSRDLNTISFKIVFDAFTGVYSTTTSVRWIAVGY